MSLSFFLHTVKWFQAKLYNSHNLMSVICLHTVCSSKSIDRTLLGVTTPGQSGPGSNGNERVFYIPQIFKAGTLPSDCLMSYPGHLLVGVGLTLLQRCSWYILQLQPTGLISIMVSFKISAISLNVIKA